MRSFDLALAGSDPISRPGSIYGGQVTDDPDFQKTLAEAIAEQIGEQIASGELRPGDRLPTEAVLTKQFGVGRSTLREALKSLEMASIIESRRSVGTFVRESYTGFLSDRLKWSIMFSKRDSRDIVEVRAALEGKTAALAAERATEEQKERLSELFSAMTEELDPEQATERDTDFHVAIAEASGNQLLYNLVMSVRNLLYGYMRWGYWQQGYGRDDMESNIAQHQPILEAIQEGKPNEASAAMLEHLDRSAAWILSAADEREENTVVENV